MILIKLIKTIVFLRFLDLCSHYHIESDNRSKVKNAYQISKTCHNELIKDVVRPETNNKKAKSYNNKRHKTN